MSSESSENDPDIPSITVASFGNLEKGILADDTRRQETPDPFSKFRHIMQPDGNIKSR